MPARSASARRRSRPPRAGWSCTTASTTPATARSTGSASRCWTSTTRASLLHRIDEWVFGPSAPYELTGDVGKVVFPCGWVLDEPTDRLHIYYGAADTSIGVATATFSDVLARVLAAPGPE